MKKKLVMIQPNTHKVYWGWYKYLDNQFDFYLIVPKGNPNIHFLKNKIIFLERKSLIEKILIPLNIGFYNMKLLGLVHELKKIKPDIIFSKILHQNYSIKAFNYAKKEKCKFYIIEEIQSKPINKILRIPYFFYKYYLKSKYKNTKIISVTKNSFNYLKKLKYNVKYIPISILEKADKVPHNQDKIRILYIGRLVKIKNIDIIIKAVNYLIEKKKIEKKNILINIVGSGEERLKLEKLAIKYKLNKNIFFKGQIPNTRLKEESKSSNIFILPSYKEAIGLVILEAMSYNLPIICSENAGASNYLNNLNGLKFNPENHKDLAKKILNLKNKKKREELGNQSLKIIKENHELNIIGKKILNIINNK